MIALGLWRLVALAIARLLLGVHVIHGSRRMVACGWSTILGLWLLVAPRGWFMMWLALFLLLLTVILLPLVRHTALVVVTVVSYVLAATPENNNTFNYFFLG